MKFAVIVVFAALVGIMVLAPALNGGNSEHCEMTTDRPAVTPSLAQAVETQGMMQVALDKKITTFMAKADDQDKALFAKADTAWHVYVLESCRLQGHEFEDAHDVNAEDNRLHNVGEALCMNTNLQRRMEDIDALIAHN